MYTHTCVSPRVVAPSQVVEVTGALEAGAPPKPELTVAVAEAALETISDAILFLGGTVEIVSAAGGVVTLKYDGPDKIRKGVELALRDSPAIDSVVFV